MKTKEFLRRLDEARVVDAIREAEKRTTGEIRVCVSRSPAPDPVEAARLQFQKFGMEKTRDRNAALVFIAPKSQSFAIWLDEGIYSKFSEKVFQELSRELANDFRQMKPTEGLVHVVEKLGAMLAEHFPSSGPNPNELSDDIGLA